MVRGVAMRRVRRFASAVVDRPHNPISESYGWLSIGLHTQSHRRLNQRCHRQQNRYTMHVHLAGFSPSDHEREPTYRLCRGSRALTPQALRPSRLVVIPDRRAMGGAAPWSAVEGHCVCSLERRVPEQSASSKLGPAYIKDAGLREESRGSGRNVRKVYQSARPFWSGRNYNDAVPTEMLRSPLSRLDSDFSAARGVSRCRKTNPGHRG